MRITKQEAISIATKYMHAQREPVGDVCEVQHISLAEIMNDEQLAGGRWMIDFAYVGPPPLKGGDLFIPGPGSPTCISVDDETGEAKKEAYL